MVIANDQVQSIIATLNRAIDTTEVISTFVQWMGTTYGPTLCALLNQESSSISLSNSSGYAVPDMLIQWMRSPDSWLAWQGWETMRKVDLTNPITGLQIEQAGFMIPLHYDHSTRGMVWVERSGPAAEVQATNEQIVTLVVGMLSARLHYLDANASWSTLVDKLNDFNQGLTQQNSVEGIWEMVHDRLPLLFDTSSFYVSLWQPDDGQLNTPVAWQDGLQVEQEPIPLMGLSKAVITQGSPLLFRDLTQETDRLADMSVELDNREPGAGARAWLGAPLRNRQNEVIGLMSMQSDLPNHFGDPDLALMTLVALQIAQAVENQRLLQTEQERRRVASTLMEVSQVIGSTLDTDIVLDRILEQLQRVIGYDRASIIVPTVDVNDGTQMVVSASQGMQVYAIGQDIRLADDNPGRYVFLSQQPVVISDLQALPSSPNRTQRQDELPVRSWMGLPMVSQGRVSGLIILEKVEPGFYSEEQASTAFALARQMAVALENARLHEKSVEASRLKSEFLANMSHELRTPLNAIIGYSEMLMSQIYGELNSKQYDRVARVVSGGKHLLEMINDVLDLSRIEAGQMNLSLVK
ncbi:MAG: GAF domain-containing protein [Anaerolineae bacterium]